MIFQGKVYWKFFGQILPNGVSVLDNFNESPPSVTIKWEDDKRENTTNRDLEIT